MPLRLPAPRALFILSLLVAACGSRADVEPRVASTASSLSVSCVQTEPEAAGVPTGAATCGRSVSLSIPAAVALSDLALTASSRLTLGSKVSIVRKDASTLAVASLGGDPIRTKHLHIGGDLWSVGNVDVDHQTVIDGTIHTTGRVLGHPSNQIGGRDENASIPVSTDFGWTLPIPQTRIVEVTASAHRRTEIAPGVYRSVRAECNATVVLRAGVYFVDELFLNDGSQVEADTTAGPIFVNVLANLQSKALWSLPPTSISVQNLLITFMGDGTAEFSGRFGGAIVAPSGKLLLSTMRHGNDDEEEDEGSNRKTSAVPDFQGVFFAKELVVGDRVRIERVPFGGWKRVRAQTRSPDEPLPTPPPPPAARPAPSLDGTTGDPTSQVRTFIAWAVGTLPSQQAELTRAITGARHNASIVNALAAEVDLNIQTNWEQSLAAVVLLASMRAPAAEAFLTDFVHRPLPNTPPFADNHSAHLTGMSLAGAGLEQLQAFAVTGLSLIGTDSASASVLEAARSHESRLVRLQAIRAHLRNRGAPGRAQIESILAPSERLVLDRFENRDLDGTTYDQRLRRFLDAHPDLEHQPGEATR